MVNLRDGGFFFSMEVGASEPQRASGPQRGASSRVSGASGPQRGASEGLEKWYKSKYDSGYLTRGDDNGM